MTIGRALAKFFSNIEEHVCEALLAFFMLLLFAQILLRQFFGYSLPWGEELATYLFVWFAYLGAVVAAKMSAHNRVIFQLRFLPATARRYVLVFADLIWVAFNLYFVWLSYDFVFNRMNAFWKSQTIGLPMKYFYMILPIAFTLMSVRIVWNNYLLLVRGIETIDPESQEIEKMKQSAAQAPR